MSFSEGSFKAAASERRGWGGVVGGGGVGGEGGRGGVGAGSEREGWGGGGGGRQPSHDSALLHCYLKTVQ